MTNSKNSPESQAESIPTPAEIQKEREKRYFDSWLSTVTPTYNWTWAHLALIRKHLEKTTTGECKRLMLFLPPRHGKSEMVTIRYPVWLMERDQETRVIVGAYNQTLANKFSRKSRRIAAARLELSADRTAVEDWETSAGGGLRAVGVGGGITGQGGHYIIIDDPVKSREEANSQAYRDRVWDWYKDDLYTRLEPGGIIVLIMTRWHEDDLAGRILASEDAPNWEVLSLKALADEGDPLGRGVGAALCPERFDEAALADIKTVLGNSFYALYQQNPQPPEGDFFKRAWFEITPVAPAGFEALVRYWDKAGTVDGDYTAGVLLGRKEGLYYVVDVVRGRWEGFDREKMIKQTAELDRERFSGAVKIWIEQEGGSSGKDSANATIRNLAGHRVYAEHPTGDKVTRAEPFQAQAMAGNVRLVSGAWNPAYLTELAAFPTGANDDQVDGSSGAFNKVADVHKLRIGWA